MTGFLALVGGDEFKPGNEEHDRLLVEHRGAGPACARVLAARLTLGRRTPSISDKNSWVNVSSSPMTRSWTNMALQHIAQHRSVGKLFRKRFRRHLPA
jgi:hypothetical protein